MTPLRKQLRFRRAARCTGSGRLKQDQRKVTDLPVVRPAFHVNSVGHPLRVHAVGRHTGRVLPRACAHHQKIGQTVRTHLLHKLLGQQILVLLRGLLLRRIPIIDGGCFDHQDQRRLVPPHIRRHFLDRSAHRRTGRENAVIAAEVLRTEPAVFRHKLSL